ncbi:MAG: DUF5063 domain-containing protein [Hymenobacter sp.]|nr:MAG: DUF5063 domain-containing protein [Hymenobacter sp.]
MKYVPLVEMLGSESFQRFTTLSRHYCLLIESKEPVVPEAFLKQMQQVLLDLYSAALKLEWIDLQTNVEPEVPKTNLPLILRVIEGKLAAYRYYWSVFDPVSMDDIEPSCGDLHDDLGDIYKELKYSLLVFDLQTADSQENAAWQFKNDFVSHWSDHCINALRALHFFIQKVEN